MSAMESVINLLLSNGYQVDGHTQSETVRTITASSYPLAGKETTFGGRQRFRLPDTSKRVTVGKRVVCVYEKEGHEAKNMQNFKTSDLAEIEKAIIKQSAHP